MHPAPLPAPPFADPAVASVFDGYAEPARGRLLALRGLIFATAAETPGVGTVVEALRWGQPSYLTPETRSGSTVRIDSIAGDPRRFAVYFHCQTDLVATFRQLYPGRFAFEGNRALHLSADDALPGQELRHCVSLALTYHSRRRRR
jgi:hypothetical protein